MYYRIKLLKLIPYLYFTTCFFACSNPSTNENSEEVTDTEETNTEDAPASEWINLFEGNNFDQWRGYLKEEMPTGGWIFDGDTLKLQREAGQPRAGDIITKEKYEDFELSFDFKLVENANSGVFYQVIEREDQLIYFNAPEFQLLDNHTYLKNTDMENMKTHLTGDNYDLYTSGKNLIHPLEEWNSGKIIKRGNHVEHWINGEKAIEFEINSNDWKERVAGSKFAEHKEYGLATSGHIGLQDHGTEIWFKEVMIRKL